MKLKTTDVKIKGALCVIFAAFGFSSMSVFVRLAGDLPTMQKAFFRNFVALIAVSVIILKNKTGFLPKKESIPFLLGRSVFGLLGLVCNFYAVDRLLLSDANMLNKLSPFFAIIFSAVILKEYPKFIQILGVITALLGSVLIIKPSFSNTDTVASLAGLLGGMGAGIAYTFVRKLGSLKEDGSKIIFFFSLFSCIFCFPFFIIEHTPFSPLQLLYLILAGVSACIGQFGITKAYIYAPAKEISVYDYSQVLFAVFFGFIIFNQKPDIFSILGYILICGAGIGMFFYNKNRT